MPFSIFKKTPSNQAIRKAKRVESEESSEARSKAFSEIDLLRTKIIEQEKEMTLLNSMLAKNEQEVARVGEENRSLTLMLEQAHEEIGELRSSNHLHSSKASRSQEELSAVMKQASMSKMSLAKLESELTTTSAERVRLERAVKDIEERHEAELSQLRLQLAAALEEQEKNGDLHKTLLQHEKTIGELRRERNQREARMKELEKWVGKEETKRKEVEVEVNRIRQQLTEARQNNAHLTAEVGTTGAGNHIVLKTVDPRVVGA